MQKTDAAETELCSDELERLRQFTLVCMKTYADSGCAMMLQAEALMAQAIALRTTAIGGFERANALALEYARAKEKHDKVIPF